MQIYHLISFFMVCTYDLIGLISNAMVLKIVMASV